MNRYQNSKIYKIYSDLGDKVYIGCTTKQYLSQRMAKHKYDYTYYKKKREDTGFAFVYSYLLFDEYGVNNCKIELLEAYPCNSIDKIRQRESHNIKTIPNINNYHNWTPERIEEKKQKEKKQAKELYDKNKIELNKKSIEYYHKNKDILTEKRRERERVRESE